MDQLLELLRLAVRLKFTIIPSQSSIEDQEIFKDPESLFEAVKLVGTEGGPAKSVADYRYCYR